MLYREHWIKEQVTEETNDNVIAVYFHSMLIGTFKTLAEAERFVDNRMEK